MNLDLGASLLTGLSTVDPADMAVARFFVYGLFGSDYDNSPYTQAGERVSRLAMAGIRLVIDEFRTDVTKTRKDGSRGKLRIDYGDSHQPEAPVKWLWKFIDGAHTAGELYGRALVVIAAEQYACAWWSPRANDHIRAAGPRTKAMPPRRSRSSPARTSRGRCGSSRPRSSARTRTAREPNAAATESQHDLTRSTRPASPPPTPPRTWLLRSSTSRTPTTRTWPSRPRTEPRARAASVA